MSAQKTGIWFPETTGFHGRPLQACQSQYRPQRTPSDRRFQPERSHNTRWRRWYGTHGRRWRPLRLRDDARPRFFWSQPQPEPSAAATVVPVPGAKAADHRCNKNPDHQKKHNRDQEFQDSKYKTKSHLVTSINEFPLGQGFINSRIREVSGISAEEMPKKCSADSRRRRTISA